MPFLRGWYTCYPFEKIRNQPIPKLQFPDRDQNGYTEIIDLRKKERADT
jgi:hypothetical protein